MKTAATFSVIDSHTAGHPTRVILSGIPRLTGDTVLAQREDFRARFDHLRPSLLHEPRGHAAMVGLAPVPSRTADYGAIFISSYVYLDMCGHATIGFAKTLAATGQISPATGPSFTLETPAGHVSVDVDWREDGELGCVRLRNVPSYIGLAGLTVECDGLGPVRSDIVYGGMWYALVDARSLGLQLVPDRVSELLRIGSALKLRIKEAVAGNPMFAGSPAPSVLFYDETGPDEAVHLLVLESNKFDRSPCGTGTSARVTQLIRRGRLAPGAPYRARNIFGVPFTARAVATTDADELVVEVAGTAYITAFSTLVIEADDPLRGGFLCR